MSFQQAGQPGPSESPGLRNQSHNIYDDMDDEDINDPDWQDEHDHDGTDSETEDGNSEFLDFQDGQGEYEEYDVDEEGGGQDATDGEGGDEAEEDFQDALEAPQTTSRTVHIGNGDESLQVTRAVLQLLSRSGFHGLLAHHLGGRPVAIEDDDGGAEEDGVFGGQYGGLLGRRRIKPKGKRGPPVPSPEGQKLMASGTFGVNDHYQDTLRKRKKSLARLVMARELETDSKSVKRYNGMIAQSLIPSSSADSIIHYDSRCYSGQFSDDGNFFFCAIQDFKVRIYDTSNPYDWKYCKTLHYPLGQWTITDASLSPDNKFIAYSSIRSAVCLALTDPSKDIDPTILEFADSSGYTGRRANRYNSLFGIWSIRFSGDGREIVAGTTDHSVYVYDIERRCIIMKVQGHNDDVNAVCFGDKSSPHIVYSGSDDTLIKVWDRRSMRDGREAGVFVGHTEGLTYVDSKGDGRYVLSNGKDQNMKLWDLRKMMATEKAALLNPLLYSSSFDYRFTPLPDDNYRPHPQDCSVVTYRGHSVLKTLIRCHFSPPTSTNSRYVYSGSEDGSVYIYNLDATLAAKVDVNTATYDTRRQDVNPYTSTAIYQSNERSQGPWKACVRDASWHPSAPVIAATAWNGWGGSTGTCSIHSWNDGMEDDEAEPRMGRCVDAYLRPDGKTLGRMSQGTRSSRRTDSEGISSDGTSSEANSSEATSTARQTRSRRSMPMRTIIDDDDGD